MAKEIRKICIMTIAATLLCQLGMALTCLPAGSVMHMPTIKNTILVGAVAFAMALGLELLSEHVLDYGPQTANSLLLVAIFLFIVSALSFLHPVIANDGRIAYRYPTLAVMGFAELAVILISKKVKPACKLPKMDLKEPGNVFVILSSLLGVMLCLLLPHETVIDYDDETHYMNTVTTSQGLYTVTDNADVRLFYWFWDHDLGFIPEARRVSDEELNAGQNDGSLYLESDSGAYDIRRTGYIAPAAGLWLGNALGLKASAKFTLGRVFNVLLYSIVMGLAVRKLKAGKMLLFTLGMCPYMIFSAACYSYDAWTMAFLSLGLATFFGTLQSKEKIDGRECLVMVGSLMLGCMSKAPYVPVMLIPLFLQKERFESGRQKQKLVFMIVAAMLLILALTFFASFGSGDPVDQRGNGDSTVSGYAQMIYIVSHPFEYAKTLFRFLFDGYIFSQKFLSETGYIGSTKTYVIVLAVMAVAALADDNGASYKMYGIRLAGLLCCLLAIIAVATTMYLIITPVASNTVFGCQPRYMVFLLFPVFMVLLNGWIKVKLSRVHYRVFYFLSTAVLLYNVYQLVIVPSSL